MLNQHGQLELAGNGNEAFILPSKTGDIVPPPSEGTMYFRSDTDTLRLRAGGAWVDLSDSTHTHTESDITDLGTYANRDAVLNVQTGTTYVPVLTDSDDMITMGNAAANTITIPANTSVAYPVGTKLNFMQIGAGQTTIAITTDNIDVESSLTLKLTGQFAVATALKISNTDWVLFGNLEAA